MSSIDPFPLTRIDGLRGPKAGRLRSFALPDDDCRQLHRHLKRPRVARLPFLGHVLRHKIMASRPLGDEAPENVVTGASCVTYAVDGGPAQTGLLSHRARSGSRSGVIPVCSLLGAALIGMRIGERAPLFHEDGTIVSLTVLDVAPPA